MTKFKKNTSLSLSLSLSNCRSADVMFTLICLQQPLSLYICKYGLDPDQTRMVFKIECFVNLNTCACGRKYAKFVVQKPMRTISLGFGSSSEAVVTRLTDPNIPFRYSKKKIRVQTPCSLSLSLYFYDLLSKIANSLDPVPDQGQTCIPRVII